LVFRIGSLGDAVISLPALREIRRRHPTAAIVLLTNSPVDGGLKAASSTQILAGTDLIDDYIEYPHGSLSPAKLLSVIRQIRMRRPVRCYFLMPNRTHAQALRDRVFFRLAGIRSILGLDPNRLGSRPPMDSDGLWESESKRLLRAIGAERHVIEADDFLLALSPSERNHSAEILEAAGIEERFAVMSIGTKRPVNDWGDIRWSQCLRELGATAPDCALIAVGAKSESERSRLLLQSWPGRTLNLCGELSPRQSAAVIARASLFLGHDSGPMHLASAVGTRIVAIFSARNHPGIWFPYAQESHVFYRAVSCRGCELDDCVEKQKHCITQIDPSDVAQRAAALLRAALPVKTSSPQA
jgi:ADP-heptose:LPS heptosyltransferase